MSSESLNRRFLIQLVINDDHNGWWWRVVVMVMTITKMMTKDSCVVSSCSLYLAVTTASLNSHTTLDVHYFGMSLASFLSWKLLSNPVMTQFTYAYLTYRNSVFILLWPKVSGRTLSISPEPLRRHTQLSNIQKNLSYLLKATEAHYAPRIHMAFYKIVLCCLGAWQVPLNFDRQIENVIRRLHHKPRPTPSRGLTYLTLQQQT